MNLIKNVSLVLIVVFYTMTSYGQVSNPDNIVPNNGFENGISGFPNSLDQINKCDDWKKVNSPEWFDDNSYPSSIFEAELPVGSVEAHTGTRYAGFGSCEGLKVELTEYLVGDNYYNIGFWFSPARGYDSEINIYLRRGQDDNNNFDPCDEDLDAEYHFVFPINAGGPDPEHRLENWYYVETGSFYVDSQDISSDYLQNLLNPVKWLFIRGSEVLVDENQPLYTYIDDVSVTSFPPCKHNCAELPTQPIEIRRGGGAHEVYVPENPILENSSEETFFISGYPDSDADIVDEGINFSVIPNYELDQLEFLIKNASRVQFEVLGNSSNPEYHMWYTDVYNYDSGMRDTVDGFVYDDYQLLWNGQRQDGSGLPVPAGFYYYKIEITSCQFPDVRLFGGINVQLNENSTPAFDYRGFEYKELVSTEDCCEEFIEIQNIIYDNEYWIREDADDYILAGENVTAGTPGEVIVEANAFLAYFAANDIILEPGFSVQEGAQFRAELHECGGVPRSMELPSGRDREERYYLEINNTLDKKFLDHNSFELKPNPTSNNITVTSTSNILNIKVLSLTGTTLKNISPSTDNNSFILEMSDLSSGTYVVICKTENGVHYDKVIKI